MWWLGGAEGVSAYSARLFICSTRCSGVAQPCCGRRPNASGAAKSCCVAAALKPRRCSSSSMWSGSFSGEELRMCRMADCGPGGRAGCPLTERLVVPILLHPGLLSCPWARHLIASDECEWMLAGGGRRVRLAQIGLPALPSVCPRPACGYTCSLPPPV